MPKNKTNKRNKRNKRNKTNKRIFKKKDYFSGDGMITSIWGPNLWHYLHTISFNYPIKPSLIDKTMYKQFILNLQYTLPCKYCRINLKKNLKLNPLIGNDLKNRDTFSRYVYNLHEIVNKMLKKESGLSYCDIRERYENFRARCTNDDKNNQGKNKIIGMDRLHKISKTKKEKGCVDPLYGKKSRSIIRIIPQYEKQKTLKIDKRCIVRSLKK